VSYQRVAVAFFRQVFLEQGIANAAWKRDIENAFGVPNLSISESKLLAAEAMDEPKRRPKTRPAAQAIQL
jgi:hypothetical protein